MIPKSLLACAGVVLAGLSVSVQGQVITEGLVFNWDNESQASGAWTSSVPGSDTSRIWTVGGDVTQNGSPVTVTTITSSYDLPGGVVSTTAASAATSANFGGLYPSASFEIWIKPTSISGGNQVIFETGGHSNGLAVTLWDDTVHFSMKFGNTFLDPSIDLTSAISLSDTADFIQIVAVVDNGTGTSALYVNAVTALTPGTADATGAASQWNGGNDAGLGGVNGDLGGGATAGTWNGSSFNTFDGEIGLVRFYNTVLTGADVAQNFAATVAIPEPGSMALLLMGGMGVVACARRRLRR